MTRIGRKAQIFSRIACSRGPHWALNFDETSLKLQRGDFVIVPIPISNPTLGTGLVAGAAYFYARSTNSDAIHLSVGEAF